MMKLGANDYFHKPSEYEDFMKLGARVKALLAAV
jgi:DNA-binding response OmpR family regulator